MNQFNQEDLSNCETLLGLMNNCSNEMDEDKACAFSRTKKLWSTKEETILADLVMSDGSRRWKAIAERMTELMDTGYHYKAKQIRNRWENHVDPSLRKGPWSKDEDI